MLGSDWVRRIRKNQGLKGFELAELLEVSAARISVLEKDEVRGAVTLKMMDRVAKAMGCRFEYRIVSGRMDRNKTEKNRVEQNVVGEIKERSGAKPRYRLVDNRG